MSIEAVSVLLGVIISAITIIKFCGSITSKLDDIDRFSASMEKISQTIDQQHDDLLSFKSELQSEVKELHNEVLNLQKENQYNTNICQVDTEILEALADHAIKTQNANGKVHRSLETLEKLKYDHTVK